MDKWEYLTPYVTYDRKAQKEWLIKMDDGSTVDGLANILNHYGSQGWELVNVVLEDWNAATFQGAYLSADGFRALFRRPKQ